MRLRAPRSLWHFIRYCKYGCTADFNPDDVVKLIEALEKIAALAKLSGKRFTVGIRRTAPSLDVWLADVNSSVP